MGWLDWLRPGRKLELIFSTHDDFGLCNEVWKALAALDSWEDVAQMEAHERVVSLAWDSTGRIGNGGFYFLFSADYRGDPGFAHTAASFQAIGAESAHRVFLQALALFPDSTPQTDLKVRRAFYGGLPEATRDEVDHAFWKADDEVPAKLAAWIRAHRPQLEAALSR